MIPLRVAKAIMAFLCSANIYISRTNLNIGIIEMVRPKLADTSSSTCNELNATAPAVNVSDRSSEWEFDWDDVEQSHMLGAYFYGYAAGQPLAGFLSHRFGPTRTTLVSMTLGTFFTFIFPSLVTLNYHAGLAARILLGLAHSPNFPSVQGSWHPWAPVSERTKLISSIYLGVPCGIVISSMFGGRLCLWFGWRSVFWFSGACNLVFIVLWFM